MLFTFKTFPGAFCSIIDLDPGASHFSHFGVVSKFGHFGATKREKLMINDECPFFFGGGGDIHVLHWLHVLHQL